MAVGVGVGAGVELGVGLGVGGTTASPPPVPGAPPPEPAPHAVIESKVARAMELWLKMRTPNFPSKHCLKGVCQELDKQSLSKMVNDFPSMLVCRQGRGRGNGNDTARACVATSGANYLCERARGDADRRRGHRLLA